MDLQFKSAEEIARRISTVSSQTTILDAAGG
jgi:hypothetical protein